MGDAKIGFSAERILAINGKIYHGRMWTMPGKERHEQDINGIPAAFILRTDTPIGEAVLPQLHTVVQFVIPAELRVLAVARLTRHPVGKETVNGIATTKYAVDETVQGRSRHWRGMDQRRRHPDEARRRLYRRRTARSRMCGGS